MKRTTISLPDELARVVEYEAKRREVSISELARQALVQHLGLRPDRPRHIPFAAVANSGTAHTAGRDAEDLLAETWSESIERDSRR